MSLTLANVKQTIKEEIQLLYEKKRRKKEAVSDESTCGKREGLTGALMAGEKRTMTSGLKGLYAPPWGKKSKDWGGLRHGPRRFKKWLKKAVAEHGTVIFMFTANW